MGIFHELLDHLGDNHVVAKVRVEVILSDLAVEIGDTPDRDLRKLLISWISDP